MITYERLWETMKKKCITQNHLIKHEKYSDGQIVTYIPDNGEPLPQPETSKNPDSKETVQVSSDTKADTSKEKKVPSLYAKGKKGIKISKKASKKASKSEKGDKSEKKAKKKNKEKEKKTGD